MIFTLLALFGAIVASYTDVKQGVIQNRLTMPLFAAGVLGHLMVGGREIVPALVMGVLLIFIVGYAFWLVGGWSAGDAKEFLFIAALLPAYPQELKDVFNPLLGPYPFIATVFINTFLAIFPFILAWGVYTSFKQGRLTGFFAPMRDVKNTVSNAAVVTAAVLLTTLLDVRAVFSIPLVFVSYFLSPSSKIALSLLIASLFVIQKAAPLSILIYFAGVLLFG